MGQGSTIARWLEDEVEEGEDDGDRMFADRPDLAIEQDMDLTRDPATGTVPRERLLAAARYNETQLALRAQQRPTTGLLSSATWVERGPTNVAGRILGLLIDPTDASGNTVWAGSAGGGLWKATNATTANVQWRNVNSFFSNLAVTTIAAVPNSSPQVMYCGTGEGYFNADAIQGAGIWKSNDGGTTWAQLPSTNNVNFAFVQKVLVQPGSNDVYAATRNGLYRSQNGGNSWTLVLGTGVAPATPTSRIADIEVAADNTLFAALGIFSTDGIYRSTSGNAGSWTKLNSLTGSGLPTSGFQRIELACAPSDANRLYALFHLTGSATSAPNVFRSDDKGTTWIGLSRPGATAGTPTFDYTNTQGWYDMAAGVSPTDPNLLYVGGLDLWMTSNGGEAVGSQVTWNHTTLWNTTTTSTRFVHADQHAIAFLPAASGASDQAYFGNDGGVFYSANASGATPAYASRNNGLNVTQYYAAAMHPTDFNYFLAGAQDNGTQRYTTPGLNVTTTATGGDGGFCAIDQLNPLVQFTSYVYNQYRRSINGGASFTTYNINTTKGSFINPFEYDSRNGALYAAYSNDTCLVWTNAGTPRLVGATTILNGLGTGIGRITHVAVSPTVQKRIYVGTNTGTVLRVDSASTTSPVVTQMRAASPGTSVSCIAVDPNNEQHMLLTYSNYGIVSVFETINAGSRTPTWTNSEGTLPDMPVRWALLDPNTPGRAMIATEMGVYTTEQLNGSATVWTPANATLANTRIDMLRYRAADQMVAAATHGRGLFTSNAFATTALAAKNAAPALVSTVYPNPFTSQVSVELAQKPLAPVSATLLDALGRRVFATSVEAGSRTFSLSIPASVAPGTYLLLVSTGSQQTARRVVKQ